MEQNLPLIAKKVWSFVRIIFFMLKKGISKTKFIADLNMMIKRGKIAGKALHNLLFHHHHNWAASTTRRRLATPHAPPPPDANDDVVINAAVMKALEMLTLTSTTASPALPGFGKSPMVKQLRITDSPFPLSNGDEDGHVDADAEKFILRFYNDLRRQN